MEKNTSNFNPTLITSPRIVYMGTPEFAVAPLEKLIKEQFNIVGIVTVPDKPSGRGLKINQSAVKKYAIENLADKEIPLMQPVSLKDEEFVNQLQKLNADIFIVVAFRMLPKIVWSMPKMGTFNLHGSLLPLYRGAAPINWAIINGETKSGVTTFLIDEEIDTGNILLQQECEIKPNETVGTLYDKLMNIGADLVVDTVKGLFNNSLKAKPQSGETKNAPKLTKELAKIKWDCTNSNGNSSAILIDRLIRGLSPYPAATATLCKDDKFIEFKIFESEVVKNYSKNTEKECGEIISDGKSFVNVVCGDKSILSLKEIQMAGKKRMKIKEFLMGFREIEKYKFI